MMETLFYISLFAVLSIILFNVMIVMAKSFKETRVQAELMQGSTIMERITRELRGATDFSCPSNVLSINTLDDSDNPKTINFTFSNSNIGVVDSVFGNFSYNLYKAPKEVRIRSW